MLLIKIKNEQNVPQEFRGRVFKVVESLTYGYRVDSKELMFHQRYIQKKYVQEVLNDVNPEEIADKMKYINKNSIPDDDPRLNSQSSNNLVADALILINEVKK